MSQSTKMIAISEVARIVTGKTPSTKESLLWNGDTPFVTPGDLQFLKNIINTGRTVSDTACVKMAKQLLPARTICVSCIGNLGYVGMTTKRSLSNQQINSLIPNNEKDAEYLYYAMKNLWQFFKKLEGQSTTLSILNKSQFSRICIPWPDEITRKQIGQTLSLIDSKIELNTQLNGYLLELMNVQYQHSFCCNKLTLGSIYDIADVVYGAAFKSALFNEEKVGYPLIRIRDLSTFSPQYWTNEAHPKRVFVHPGDVLAGMDAEFTPCLWQGEMAVLNQRVCLFEPAANSGVSRSYLLMALNPLLAFIQNYASGTTVAHMGKGDLEALNVPIPARGDLERFNTIAEPLREQIVQNSTQNRKLAALRDALLPKLMSGEIDLSRVDFTQLNSHLA